MAEIVAALSLATDLGYGQPVEHAMRCSVIAVQLCDALEMEGERVGCFADANPCRALTPTRAEHC